MSSNESMRPVDRAIRALKRRIENDQSLDVESKEAVLADLNEDNPGALDNLRALVEPGDGTYETGETDSE